MKYKFLIAILVTVSRQILSESEQLDVSLLKAEFRHLEEALEDDPKIFFNPPTNKNNSIQYRIYTVENRNAPCYIEPSVEEFDKCSFNPNQDTKFLIHGYMAKIPLGKNLFEELKDTLLDDGSYNVILVDWTLYNNFPYTFAYNNARTVGIKVGEMMKFIQNHTGVSPETLHCIGHSLGAHVCGQAGRLTSNLGRITGLDPAGISKSMRLKPNIRLRHTDANFVDAIHTSDIFADTGPGLLDAVGDMDFYPNGGVVQPHCKSGRSYKLIYNKVLTVQNHQGKSTCNHHVILDYFRYSVFNNCTFMATKCDSYSNYKQNQCAPDGNPITAEMGFHCKKIPGLPPGSKFFLETLEFEPYCKGRT